MLVQPLLAAAEHGARDQQSKHQDAHHKYETLFKAGEAKGAEGEMVAYDFVSAVTCPVQEMRKFLQGPTDHDRISKSELKYRLKRWREMKKMHESKHLYPIPFSFRDKCQKVLCALVLILGFMVPTWTSMTAHEPAGSGGHGSGGATPPASDHSGASGSN